MEALTRLKQSTTVATYKAQFEAFSNRLKGLPDGLKLNCFLRGLKDEIRLPLRMFNLVSLNTTFGLAKIQEEYMATIKRSFKAGGSEKITMATPSNSVYAPTSSEGGRRWNKPYVPAKEIFSMQMDEKHKKGLCYHYDGN